MTPYVLGINYDYKIDNDNGLKVASVHKPHSSYPIVSPIYNFFKDMSHLSLMSNSKNVSNFCLFIWQLQPQVQFKNMSNLDSKFSNCKYLILVSNKSFSFSKATRCLLYCNKKYNKIPTMINNNKMIKMIVLPIT